MKEDASRCVLVINVENGVRQTLKAARLADAVAADDHVDVGGRRRLRNHLELKRHRWLLVGRRRYPIGAQRRSGARWDEVEGKRRQYRVTMCESMQTPTHRYLGMRAKERIDHDQLA